MTDYTRYTIDNTEDEGYPLGMWCTDCTDESGQDERQIWQHSDEQATALCLANLMALADEHEEKRHAEASACIGHKVAAAMNEKYPDPDGGRWSAVVMGGEP